MKRIMLSVFAAAITAAWAVPASAADVTFGGQYRLRGEYRNNADFDKNANDHTDFWDQRVRLSTNIKATEDTSLKITLQDSRRWGANSNAAGGPSLTDSSSTNNTVDLHESYLNVDSLFGAPVSLRAGRQELVYGDERLVGAFNWSNNGRSFDALKFTYKSDVVDVDLFTSKIKEDATGTANTTGKDQDFHGIYATVKAVPNNTIDVYALLLRDDPETNTSALVTSNTTSYTGINKTQRLITYGARLKGAVAGADYTVELPIQTGRIETATANNKIKAYAFAAKAGYTLPTPMKIRVGAEYDFASGDKDSTDNKIKTFSNLFPTNHDKLGLMDEQGWRNVKAWNLNASVDVNEKLRVFASYWRFKLAQEEDGWYDAGDWMVSPGTASGSSARHITQTDATKRDTEVGSEIDLVATYKYNSAVTAELGVARFFSGKFIENQMTGTMDEGNQDWAYLMLTANF